MATTIDNKTVQMNFDNSNFEKNISQSMDSLKNMDKQLNTLERSKSLETLNRQAQNVDFSNMEHGLESVKAHFSTLQVAGMTVISELTRSFMKFGSGLMHNVFGQIKQGGLTRALNIEQASFQVKGLVGGGKKAAKTWKNLLKDVNYAVDDTAYGLDEAAKVASQLMASNIKIGPQMKAALRGVSGMAAMTGRSYSDIGNIYTKIAGNGRVMSQELLQFSASGLNAAATLTKYVNKHKKAREQMIKAGLDSKQASAVKEFANNTKLTEQNIRTLVTAGAVDFKNFSKAMDEAFGPHSKKANETFTGSLANVKAALSRIGEPIATKAINRLRDIFNALIPKLKKIKENLEPVYKLLKKLIDQAYKGIKKVIKRISGKKISSFLKIVLTGIKTVVSSIKNIYKTIKTVKDSLKKGLFGDLLKDFSITDVFNKISGFFEKIFNYVNEKKEVLATVFSSYRPIIDNFISIIKTVKSVFTDSKSSDQTDLANFFISIGDTLSNLSEKVKKIVETLQPLVVSIIKLFKKMFKGITDAAPKGGVKFSFFDAFIDILGNVVDAVTKFIDDLAKLNIHPLEIIKTILEKVSSAAKKIAELLKKGASGLKEFAERVKSPFLKVMNKIGEIVKKVFGVIANAVKNLGKTIIAKNAMIIKGSIFVILVKQITKLVKAITDYLTKKPEKAFDQLKNIPSKINSVFDSISSAINTFKQKTNVENLKTIATSILMIAAALYILSSIEPDKLSNGLSAITVLIAELGILYKVINKNSKTLNIFQKSTTGGAEALTAVAAAVLLLATSVAILAKFKPDQLTAGVIAIGALLAELVGVLKIISTNNKKYTTGAITIIAIAAAVRILASVVKDLGSLDVDTLKKGLISIGLLLLGIAAFMAIISVVTSKIGNKFIKSALAILIVVAAIRILSNSVKELGSLNIKTLKQGLLSVGALLLGIVVFMGLLSAVTSGIGNKFVKAAVSLLLVVASIKMLANVVAKLGALDIDSLKKGLIGVGALLGIILMFMSIMAATNSGVKMLVIANALAVMSVSMIIFQKVVEKFGNMAKDKIVTGIVALASTLATLWLFITLINSNMKGVVGLFVVANALLVLSASMLVLSTIPIAGLAVGILALIGVLTVLGVASKILGPLIPAMLSLAGTMALVGAASIILGTGLILVGAGLLALSAGILDMGKNVDKVIKIIVNFITTLVTSIAEALSNLLEPVSKILFQLFDIIIRVISETAPQLADALITLLLKVLQSLATNIGPIISAVLDIIIGILNGVAERVGDLFAAIGNLLGSIGQAIIDAVGNIDPAKIMNMLLAVGVIAAIFVILSKLKTQMAQAIISVALMAVSLLILTGVFALIGMIDNSLTEKLNAITVFLAVMTLVLIGCAIIGNFAAQALIGLGVLIIAIAAITAVMAALGVLADKIEPFIDKGGPLLVKIGSFIGQFIGAFVAGIAIQAVQAIPALGAALGAFGVAIGPFISALNNMSLDALAKIAILVAIVAAITATSFLTGITKFLSFGNDPIDEFIETICKLARGFKKFNSIIDGVDGSGAAVAADVIAKLALAANLIPSSGGWLQNLVGNKDLDGFGQAIVSLANGLKTFANSVDTSIDVEALTPYVNIVKKMAEIANLIPRSGGWLQNIAGNKDLAGFGDDIAPLADGIKSFADKAVEIKDPAALDTIIGIVKKMVDVQNDLPKSGGLWQALAGEQDWSQLSEGLTSMVDCFKSISGSLSGKNIDLDSIKTAVDILKDLAKVNTDAIKIGDKADKNAEEGDSATFVSKIAEPVKKAVDKMKEYQKTLKQTDMEGMVSYFKVLKKFINKLGNTFSDEKTQKNLKLVKKIGDILTNLLDSVTKIKGLMTSKKDDKSGKDDGDLSSKLKAFADAIINFSTKMASLDLKGMETAKSAVKTLKSMSDLKIGKFENAKKSVNNLKAALTAFKDLNKKENQLSTGKGSQLESLKKYVKAVKGALKEFANGLDTKGFKKKLSEISSFGKKMSTFASGLKAVAGAFKKINETGVSADKGTAVQKAMANVSKAGVEKFYKGLKGKKSEITSAFKKLLAKVKTVSKEITNADSFISIGRNLINGIIKGINDRTENLKKAMSFQITAAFKVTKKKAKIKSPSKLWEEIGKYIMEGEALGILKNGKKVDSALETVTQNSFNTQVGRISSTAVTNSATKLTSKFAKRIKQATKDSMRKAFYKTGGALESLFAYYYDTSKFDQSKVVQIVGKAQDQLKKAAITLYEATNPDQAADERAQRKALNDRITKNKNIMKKYKGTWKTYSKKKGKKKKTYYKKHKKAIKKYKSAKDKWKKAKDERRDLDKTIRDNRTSAWQDLGNAIKDNARSFMDPLAQAIDYGLNLFDKFEQGQRISAGRMLANYASNVKGIEKYNSALEELKKRVSPEMYAELKSQGISALPQIEAINRMSNQQLNDLKIYEATNNRQKFENMLSNLKDRIVQAKSWKEKIVELTKRGLNKDALQEILNMGMEEAGPYLNALLSADKGQIAEFNKYFAQARTEENNMAKVGQASYAKSATGGINKAANKKAGKSAALNYGAGLIKGLQDKKKNKQVSEAAYKLADNIVKAVNKRLGIKSPAKEGKRSGMYTVLGLVQGIGQNLALAQNAGEELADAVIDPLQSLENAQNTLDGEPTITPILDLDRLENDLHELDNMFKNDYAIGIAASMSRDGNIGGGQHTQRGDIINNYNNEFTQNNYSPEPLDRVGIYRDTKGWINSKMKGGVATT